jgi:signal peptidase I
MNETSQEAVTKATGTNKAADDPSEARSARTRKKPVWREYTEALLVAGLLALIIRTFLFQAFHIPSGSMENTLLEGDFLFVSKTLYGAEVPLTGGKRLPAIRPPHRGDIIVFRYPEDPSQDFIKRCIGVPGDVIEYRDKKLFVNGELQDEDYIKHSQGQRIVPGRDNFGPITVPEGKFFMLGDNRDNSRDSRYWGFVDYSQLRGKALFIYWSWDKDHNLPRLSRIFDLVR